jgi:23S rRNA (adenine2503-C2)-methyltransferase
MTQPQAKQNIVHYTPTEFENFLGSIHEPIYRTKQIFAWIYQKYVGSFQEMSNISKAFRSVLEEHFVIEFPKIKKIQHAEDGTKKFLFELPENPERLIESVLLPDEDRATICLSTQTGCTMGCKFCRTAQILPANNLQPGEIVGQVVAIQNYLTRHESRPEAEGGGGPKITNLVFMGMGEPLLNYTHLLRAIDILTYSFGPHFSTRRITVSTCGIVPKILDLGRDTLVNLAVSLNAPNDEIRRRIMPISEKFPMPELINVLKHYELPHRRRITIEYVMVAGLNNAPAHAQELVKSLRGLKCKVNLIPLNPFPGCELAAPTMESVLQFEEILRTKGVSAFIRKSRGQDIKAACGQLTANDQ